MQKKKLSKFPENPGGDDALGAGSFQPHHGPENPAVFVTTEAFRYCHYQKVWCLGLDRACFQAWFTLGASLRACGNLYAEQLSRNAHIHVISTI
jgi:hypothetical protein